MNGDDGWKQVGKKWFSNRVVDEWNGLSNQVVSAKTIGSFKARLDKYMDGDDSENRQHVLIQTVLTLFLFS